MSHDHNNGLKHMRLYRKALLLSSGFLLWAWIGESSPAHGFHCQALSPCSQSDMPPPPPVGAQMGYWWVCKETGDYHWTCQQGGPGDKITESQCEAPGCIIGIENQTLAEEFAVADTPYVLRYQSDRVPGRTKVDPVIFPHTRHFAGWSLTVHHFFDWANRVVYMGDGTKRYLKSEVMRQGDTFFVPNQSGTEIYVFDIKGRHLETFDAATRYHDAIGTPLYRFSYDAQGLLVAVANRTQRTTIKRDTTTGTMTVISPPPLKRETILTLDVNGYLGSLRDPLGNTIHISSSSTGLLEKKTDALQHVTQFTYDTEGRLIKETDASSNIHQLHKRVNTPVTEGHTIDFVSALNRKNSYTVELLSDVRQRRVIDPIGHETVMQNKYDGTTGTMKFPDGTEVEETFKPDSRFGMQTPILTTRLTKLPSGLTSTMKTDRATELDPSADPVKPANPLNLRKVTNTVEINGHKISFRYEAVPGSYEITTPEGRKTTAQLYSDGRLKTLETPAGEAFIFDHNDSTKTYSVERRSGSTVRTTRLRDVFVSGRRELHITDASGSFSTLTLDGADRISLVSLPGKRSTRFQYDAAGNVIAVTPPDNPPFTQQHQFSYTPDGLVATYDDPVPGPGAHDIAFHYNSDKQLTKMSHAGNETVTLQYDNAGRLASLTEPSTTLTYGYSAETGTLSTIGSTAGVNLAYDYDGPLVTKTSWSGPVSGSVERSYDANFRVDSLSINGSNKVDYQYDQDSLLVRAGDLALHRHAAGGYLLGATIGSVQDTWEYNGFLEPTRYRVKVQGTDVFDVHFQRDALGRVTEKIEVLNGKRQRIQYVYDKAGRLEKVIEPRTTDLPETALVRNGSRSYGYDPNGNRVSLTTVAAFGPPRSNSVNASYDKADRLLKYGNASYTYNALGQVQTISTPQGVTTYTHNSFGNLIGVALPAQNQIRYLLDGRQRRVGKQVNGTFTGGFLYAGTRVIATTDPNNNVESVFVYGTRGHVPDYFMKGSETYRLITDHLGSVRLVINTATGQIVQEFDYDEFGRVLKDTNSGFQPFGFAGGMYDADTGLVNFSQRDYDPNVGRWISRDPLLFDGGDANLYAYVDNDPTNAIDPLGLWRWPDYIIFNINIAIPTPWTATLVGWSGTLSIDRYGQTYWSPLGLGIGKSATAVSGSLTANWLNMCGQPSAQELDNFLTQHGFSFSGGFWAGLNENWTPGSGFSTGVGFVSPQIGASYNYSFRGPNTQMTW